MPKKRVNSGRRMQEVYWPEDLGPFSHLPEPHFSRLCAWVILVTQNPSLLMTQEHEIILVDMAQLPLRKHKR